jgi:type IV secretory pathway TrbD component
MTEPIKKKTDNSLLLKYAGLATQLLVGLALAVFVGLKIDKWIGLKTPVAVWLLPLLVIAALIYKVIKDTTIKK